MMVNVPMPPGVSGTFSVVLLCTRVAAAQPPDGLAVVLVVVVLLLLTVAMAILLMLTVLFALLLATALLLLLPLPLLPPTLLLLILLLALLLPALAGGASTHRAPAVSAPTLPAFSLMMTLLGAHSDGHPPMARAAAAASTNQAGRGAPVSIGASRLLRQTSGL